MTMGDLFNKTFYFGLGALTITKEKAEEIVETWVKKGEVSRDEAKTWVDEFVAKGEKEKKVLEETINTELNNIINEANLATKEDITRLEEKIEELKGIIESR
ncbi:MAG: polyhydroxyalkanoate synthesis regulator [Candidatus Syntrophonatronum acetioxidans]|uniref:Polyhydroxyalkanoate synthesis regulator n=1 Tax=Candidatus Syntrophonatronum acetioxidans TaxID=1795816 RepID=A0A424YI01_9FIRM|nr:MAG: polyhydroxyalkanoate synthesis regulator [Candidatus Syntrophonatronum acetioxidans]